MTIVNPTYESSLTRLVSLVGEMMRSSRPASSAADLQKAFPQARMCEMFANLTKAKTLYRDRQCRADLFQDKDLFGEPAWDMLLDLYIAVCEHRNTSVSSVCIAAAVPSTTALRWLAILESKGLVVRSADPSDGRRSFITLSNDGWTLMTSYLNRLAASG